MRSPAPVKPIRLPLELYEPLVTRGLSGRWRLGRLLRLLPERWVWALFMFICGFLAIAILTAAAMVTRSPFIFPSLGPTAILFFFHPMSPSASPRHAIYGHAIAILCGYGSLVLVGLEHEKVTLGGSIDVRRLIAIALSLSLTAALMILLKAAHAPAGATTLIISLGLMTSPLDLLMIEVAVILLTAEALIINRLAGLKYPLWATRVDSSMGSLRAASQPARANLESRAP